MAIKRLKKVALVFLFLILLGGSLVVVFSYSIVKKFIFRRIHKQEWLKQNDLFNERLRQEYGGQLVTFDAVDGSKLAGLIFIRPQAQRNILLCHGYSRTKERLYYLVKLFPDDNILIFDYRAHGQSSGDFTTIGFYEKNDVLAAYKFFQSYENEKNLPIFGIGVSMGAVSLLGAAVSGADFKGIVVDSAFKQLDEQICSVFYRKTGLPAFPFMNVCQIIFEYMCNCSMHEVNAVQLAKNIKIPILIIHSNHDNFAHVAAAHAIYDAVQGRKKLWLVDDAVHGRVFKRYPEDYVREVVSFFDAIDQSCELF